MVEHQVFNLADFEKEAQEIIKEAQKKASHILERTKQEAEKILHQVFLQKENIINNAKKEVEKIKKEGYNAGFEEGLKKGFQDEQITNIKNTLKSICEEIHSKKQELLSQKLFDSLLEYAFMVAKKIIKAELKINKEVVIENLKSAVQLIVKKHQLQVFINPQDYEVIQKFIPDLKKIFTEIEQVELFSDENISGGSCMVKTRESIIDADINTQLALLEKNLFGK
jgi:flagellar assembly protein FliH